MNWVRYFGNRSPSLPFFRVEIYEKRLVTIEMAFGCFGCFSCIFLEQKIKVFPRRFLAIFGRTKVGPCVRPFGRWRETRYTKLGRTSTTGDQLGNAAKTTKTQPEDNNNNNNSNGNNLHRHRWPFLDVFFASIIVDVAFRNTFTDEFVEEDSISVFGIDVFFVSCFGRRNGFE